MRRYLYRLLLQLIKQCLNKQVELNCIIIRVEEFLYPTFNKGYRFLPMLTILCIWNNQFYRSFKLSFVPDNFDEIFTPEKQLIKLCKVLNADLKNVVAIWNEERKAIYVEKRN